MDSSFSQKGSTAFRLIWYWSPVAIMFAAMFVLSTDTFSDKNTTSIIGQILKWFDPHVSRHAIRKADFWARKTAHFSEYAVLAVLLFSALRADNLTRWRLSWFLLALGAAACWSLLDEFHQSFTLTRGPSIYDSLLDTTGAFCALVVFSLLTSRRRRQVQNPNMVAMS